MQIEFTKMHGCGNDYVYINGFTQKVPNECKPDLARKFSDRHFGIGSDGVIFINPAEEADFEMEMYNLDGSRGEMCGNGIRCVAAYVYEKGMTDRTEISVVSAGAVKYLILTVEEGHVTGVRVDMGKPILDAEDIPVAAETSPVVNEPLLVDGKEYRMTCVSMGNPHAVIYVDEVKDLPLTQIGHSFENHERFPRRTNTEFVKILSRDRVSMRVWERGSGETLACGTGCCAICVAGVLNGVTDRKIVVEVLGGELQIEWMEEDGHVYMTGPAEIVFDGTIAYNC